MTTKKELQEQIEELNSYTKELEDLCTMLAEGYRQQLEANHYEYCQSNPDPVELGGPVNHCKSLQDHFGRNPIIQKLRAIE